MNFPLPLKKIVESIADDLPKGEGQAFTAAITAASEGKDLSAVHWAFLAGELRAIRAMLDLPKHIQALVDEVIVGMDRLAAGKEWPEAAKTGRICYDIAVNSTTEYAACAAFYAADAAVSYAKVDVISVAYAATYAAEVAAGAAGSAADAAVESASYVAAEAAARQRQCDALLEIIDSAS